MKNIRDLFLLLIGIWQSMRLLKKIKPDVIYTPGGFVGVPVGVASRVRRIPFVTHDLDATPGLANRINARWAVVHVVSMPKSLYPYPEDKMLYLGVPVGAGYKPVTEQSMLAFRREVGLADHDKVLLVTGGGLGAQRINDAVTGFASELLSQYPRMAIVHIVGRKNEIAVKKLYAKSVDTETLKRIYIKGYITDMHRYSGAADLIVTRAGATALAEFAVQNKACIVIPNPFLTGGHQMKNIEPLQSAGAISVVTEDALRKDPRVLLGVIGDLLENESSRRQLSSKITDFGKLTAAKDVARLLLEYDRVGKSHHA